MFLYCFTTVHTCFFFFSSRRRHTRSLCDWSSDVCSSDLFRGQVLCGQPIVALARADGVPLEMMVHAGEEMTLDAAVAAFANRALQEDRIFRSEERRVGKEGRSRWSPDH